MADPLTNIEDEKAQVDLGVMLHRVYRGAIQDGGTWVTAYLTTAAFAHGMFKSSQKDDDEEEGGDNS